MEDAWRALFNVQHQFHFLLSRKRLLIGNTTFFIVKNTRLT